MPDKIFPADGAGGVVAGDFAFCLAKNIQNIGEKTMVRAAGIEPALCHQNWILSPARLPVPPRPHGAAITFVLGTPSTTFVAPDRP